MRRDASFGYDTRADTWKEISLIWFGNDRVTRARGRREAEREWVWGKKEIDQRGGGNGIVLQAMHFPLVKPSFVLFLTLVSNAFSDLTWRTTPVCLSGFVAFPHSPSYYFLPFCIAHRSKTDRFPILVYFSFFLTIWSILYISHNIMTTDRRSE